MATLEDLIEACNPTQLPCPVEMSCEDGRFEALPEDADGTSEALPEECITLLHGIHLRASKEHERLQTALSSERLRAARERALKAGTPGPRVLLREELRRAEHEVAALAVEMDAARSVLMEHATVGSPPRKQCSWPSRWPTRETSLASEGRVSPSENSSSSSSSGEDGIDGSSLRGKADAWLRQERNKNLVQPYCYTAERIGGESLLYREALARMELDEAKSRVVSEEDTRFGFRGACIEAFPPGANTDADLVDTPLLCEAFVEESSSLSTGTPGAASEEAVSREASLLRQSQLLQAQNRAFANVQRLMAVAENANGLAELSDARSELAVAIEAAKRHGVLEVDLKSAEALRRRVHNCIEDLKGSIRVYCCVRPLSCKEMERGDTSVVAQIDDMTVGVNNLWERSSFSFDAVFLPSEQADVFNDCRDLIQSALDGHNVTIFAYGQTSAGKTHTLFGQPGKPGLAPRMIHEIYNIMKRQGGRFSHSVNASMLELYRNDLVDLLNKESPRSDAAKKLIVRLDKQGVVHVDNLVEETCHSADELAELVERGQRHRTTRATAMNAQSSRSHLVFTVRVRRVNLETGEELRGKIMICDLAGSERLKKAMVSGEAAKEAIEINRSLAALGDVVAALRQGQKQIPYRNHKLTQLMQDSLTSASKVLMFVNCSPASSNVEETLMSLKYAARAKKIQMGHAKGRRSGESSVSPRGTPIA